jgi:hypothetical protein
MFLEQGLCASRRRRGERIKACCLRYITEIDMGPGSISEPWLSTRAEGACRLSHGKVDWCTDPSKWCPTYRHKRMQHQDLCCLRCLASPCKGSGSTFPRQWRGYEACASDILSICICSVSNKRTVITFISSHTCRRNRSVLSLYQMLYMPGMHGAG